jgi:hypothetical protein
MDLIQLACPKKLNVQKVNCRKELLPNNVNRFVVATWKGGWLELEKQKENTKLQCSYHMFKIFWLWVFVQLPCRRGIKPLNKLFCSSIICCCLFCNRCFNIFAPIFTLLIAQIQLSLLLHMSASCYTFLTIVYANFKSLRPILATTN